MGIGIDTGQGVLRIGRERRRQKEEKGWTPERDATEHADGSLLDFAVTLLLDHQRRSDLSENVIDHSAPWVENAAVHAYNKYRTEPLRWLEIAGALIAAEIDRLLATTDIANNGRR